MLFPQWLLVVLEQFLPNPDHSDFKLRFLYPIGQSERHESFLYPDKLTTNHKGKIVQYEVVQIWKMLPINGLS